LFFVRWDLNLALSSENDDVKENKNDLESIRISDSFIYARCLVSLTATHIKVFIAEMIVVMELEELVTIWIAT